MTRHHRRWQIPPTTPLPSPHPADQRTVPAIITRILSRCNHKNYGTRVTANLAPGAAPPDDSLPREVKELLTWHNGYNDPFCDEVVIVPREFRLLSYEEALGMFNTKMGTAPDRDWWNEDIWPVLAEPDLQTFIVVSKSTGRAGYRLDVTDLTDEEEMLWFPGLYEVLRVIEVALEERRVDVRNGSGAPWDVKEEKGGGGFVEVDEEDASQSEEDGEEDDEEEDEEDEDAEDDGRGNGGERDGDAEYGKKGK